MMTVSDISKQTGISVRTLHYYDEIGLLTPTGKSKAGYRLYDVMALEQLQQILFFREFDIPLKEIKAIMEDPTLEKNQILQMQRKMLVVKEQRIKRLIASIDKFLKGDSNVNFEIFNKTEIEQLCQTTINHMPGFMQQSIVQEFGGLEQWKHHYVQRALREDMQKGYQKLVACYGGDKEHALNIISAPPNRTAAIKLEKQTDTIMKKLVAKKQQPLNSPDIKELVGKYSLIMKQFYQMKHEKELMLSVAASYRDKRAKPYLDAKYGKDAAEYFAMAIEAFYKSK